MIFLQKGLRTNNLEPINAPDPLKWIAEFKQEPFRKEEVENVKTNRAYYFLSGNLRSNPDGSYTRNNDNLISRDLIVIDYDEIATSAGEFIETIEDKLKDYRYVLYPSINNGIKGTRYRLVLDASRDMNKQEFEATFDKVVETVGVPADRSSSTYSQVQGAPIFSKDSDSYEVLFNEGKPFEVVEVKPIESVVKKDYPAKEFDLSENELDCLVLNYIENDHHHIQDEKLYINIHYSILKDVQEGNLTIEQAEKYVKWLAGDNEKWKTGNIERLRKDIRTNVKPKTEWSFISKLLLLTENTIEEELSAIGNKKREEKIEQWNAEGNRGRKPSKLTPLEISMILQQVLIFKVFDHDEHSRVAMYLEDEGIYTQNEAIIRRYIKHVERQVTERESSEVIYDLRHTVEFAERTNSRYLIPVGNGVFNLKTKRLEPFTPDYIFTTKIASPYVERPIEPIINGFSIENWLLSIANGDKEVKETLWQVISASLNGNYSRRKSIWLVGDGRNGKGTFQDLIRNLVGKENVATLKMNQFQERFSLPMLEGKTVCIGDDVPAGVYVDDSSNFNSVITGDAVAVENKMKPLYATNFHLTVIQSTNGMPKIHNKTNGTYRRLLIIPFNARFTTDTDNRAIKEEYVMNHEILEYVLYKAINLDFENFTVPSVSQTAMREYVNENDPVADFKTSFFDLYEWGSVPTSFVYDYYTEFCHKNNFSPLSSRKFNSQFIKILGDEWGKEVKHYDGTNNGYPETLPYIHNLNYSAGELIAGKSYMTFYKK